MLSEELDDVIADLTAFDVLRIEDLERRLRTVSPAQLADSLELPQVAAKHALLGQMLTTTAANLKVLVSVLHLEPRLEMR